MLGFLRPCAQRLLGFIDECCGNEEAVRLEAEAMRLDLYYAQMVKGAIANSSVNRGVVWTSSELMDVSDDVSSKLDDILPKVRASYICVCVCVRQRDTESVSSSARPARVCQETHTGGVAGGHADSRGHPSEGILR